MNQGINLQAVYVADIVGILLMGIILLIKAWDLPGRKEESRILFALILFTFFDCLFDPFIFIVDGKPGRGAYLVNFIGNSFLFLYNLVVGTGVLALVARHINKKISKLQYRTVWVITVIETVLLLVNIVHPVVFYVDQANVYHRGPGYFVYIAAAFYLLFYSLYLYFRGKLKDGSVRYFPVWEFLLPIAVGVTLQTIFYGISLQPVCFAVAFSSIVVCLQNEYLYVDKLTGVYNRYEIDKIKSHYLKRNAQKVAALMLDMNDFKAINDTYSHNAGDEALSSMARILVGIVGNDGNVIRFAGDEFVIILNGGDENTVPDYKKRITDALDAYNNTSGKPYQLAAAIGGSVFDLDKDTDFLSRIDALMYEDKQEYYRLHDRRKRD